VTEFPVAGYQLPACGERQNQGDSSLAVTVPENKDRALGMCPGDLSEKQNKFLERDGLSPAVVK
jgi:hypothetical protein